MTDDLLPYFNRELAHIRREAADFADRHPAQAARLKLAADTVADPHVERLIQAFAYLSGRVHMRLDDELPELTDALLGVLYPHYTAPVPSMAIACFAPVDDLAESYVLPAGTDIETLEGLPEGECRFRTAYPVSLWPIRIAAASLTGRPLNAPANPAAQGAASVLRLTLECTQPDLTFESLALDRLRIFLAGAGHVAQALYELLFTETLSIAYADSVGDPTPVILGPDHLIPVGFEAEEAVLPFPARSFPGYRLLSEFFAFPDKFRFLDLTGLNIKALKGAGRRIEVFIYLSRAVPELERVIGPDNFALGCTPVVNLFEMRAEPIRLTEQDYEYRVVPDARRRKGIEVHSVLSVSLSDPAGHETQVHPFYSIQHSRGAPSYWHVSRRPAVAAVGGSDVFLSLVSPAFDPAVPAHHDASVRILALNRDLPERLIYGGGRPRLHLTTGAPAVGRVTFLAAPTRTLRSPLGKNARWRLVSHLLLNHLSLDGEGGVQSLKEILGLYNINESPETMALIDGIAGLSTRRGTARAPRSSELNAFCRGIDVTLDLAQGLLGGAGGFLLAAVLDRFLGLHAAVNAFTRLTVRAAGSERVLKQWPPRAGARPLL